MRQARQRGGTNGDGILGLSSRTTPLKAAAEARAIHAIVTIKLAGVHYGSTIPTLLFYLAALRAVNLL